MRVVSIYSLWLSEWYQNPCIFSQRCSLSIHDLRFSSSCAIAGCYPEKSPQVYFSSRLLVARKRHESLSIFTFYTAKGVGTKFPPGKQSDSSVRSDSSSAGAVSAISWHQEEKQNKDDQKYNRPTRITSESSHCASSLKHDMRYSMIAYKLPYGCLYRVYAWRQKGSSLPGMICGLWKHIVLHLIELQSFPLQGNEGTP